MTVAQFWHHAEGGKIQCDLCPHSCLLADGGVGRCRVRKSEGGKLIASGYGLVSSAGMDPIEKKPLYHFHPGSMIFSIGGWGCNLSCDFCQNWSLSQQGPQRGAEHTPGEVVAKAEAAGSIGIAYTYNEPLVGYEFVASCATWARERGLLNVLVTNGFIQPAPASELLPLIDALNIDIKSMDEDFYRDRCGASLAPPLAFSRQASEAGCLVEITTLLIPGLNDDEDQLTRLAKWIAGNLGRDVPLHLSAYRPQYKSEIRATTTDEVLYAYEICRRELRYVYVGNVMTSRGQDTHCPGCGGVLIQRQGYRTRVKAIKEGRCSLCGQGNLNIHG